MKSKEEILEGYFGSDYWLLKERDDLQYILRAMDEYAKQKLQHGVSGKRPTEEAGINMVLAVSVKR